MAFLSLCMKISMVRLKGKQEGVVSLLVFDFCFNPIDFCLHVRQDLQNLSELVGSRLFRAIGAWSRSLKEVVHDLLKLASCLIFWGDLLCRHGCGVCCLQDGYWKLSLPGRRRPGPLLSLTAKAQKPWHSVCIQESNYGGRTDPLST